MLWGVIPTPRWLSRRSRKVQSTCCRCDEPDDLKHLLLGCFIEAPEARPAALRDWRLALVGTGLEEPQPLRDDKSYIIREFMNGIPMPHGSIRFERETPAATDGSAKFVGTRFAVSSGSAVQIGRD